MSEAEMTAVYRRKRKELCRYLEAKFHRLNRPDCEDLVQIAYAETLRRVRETGFEPEKGWWPYFRWLASKRALDCLREKIEVTSFETLMPAAGQSTSAGWEPPDPGMPPSQILARIERRGRQGIMFSEVLEEFCRHCERDPRMLKQKEVYERSVRGQTPEEIAAAMGISRGSVDVDNSRARKWVLNRVRQKDVHHSVFLTLHRRKPED